MIDITREVEGCLTDKLRASAWCFVQHTTCGLTVNENADPDVQTDMLGFLRRLIPQQEPNFKHGEQNSDADIKSSLVGSSVTVPFENGRLYLAAGRVYICANLTGRGKEERWSLQCLVSGFVSFRGIECGFVVKASRVLTTE